MSDYNYWACPRFGAETNHEQYQQQQADERCLHDLCQLEIPPNPFHQLNCDPPYGSQACLDFQSFFSFNGFAPSDSLESILRSIERAPQPTMPPRREKVNQSFAPPAPNGTQVAAHLSNDNVNGGRASSDSDKENKPQRKRQRQSQPKLARNKIESNREAARRCREKKRIQQEALEQKARLIFTQHKALTQESDFLKAFLRGMKCKAVDFAAGTNNPALARELWERFRQ